MLSDMYFMGEVQVIYWRFLICLLYGLWLAGD